MDNCILFDWLTFTSKDMTISDAITLLGLDDCDWESGLSSSLRYAYRNAVGGISIHYTPDNWQEIHPGVIRNPGICVEMSGQGCREYETYGRGDFPRLLWGLVERGCHITRLDLAYDDFDGKIDMQRVAQQAIDLHFTSRMSRRSVIRDVPDLNLDHDGLTVTHGARSSNIMIRIYDKRCERQRYELSHWVRCEIQFRHADADGVALRIVQGVPVGQLYAGVLTQYLNYRDKVNGDSNKSRWPVSGWWQALIGAVEPITVHTKKDVVYNRDKLNSYVYGQAKFALRTAIALDGMYGCAEKLLENKKPLPKKYKDLLRESGLNSAAILKELGVYDDAGNG